MRGDSSSASVGAREATLAEGRFSLEGKAALVTGASRGIGRAIALALAEHGANVAVAARSLGALEETAAEIRACGARALVVPCDVTASRHVEEAVARTISGLDGLEVVVNNAAAPGSCPRSSAFGRRAGTRP